MAKRWSRMPLYEAMSGRRAPDVADAPDVRDMPGRPGVRGGERAAPEPPAPRLEGLLGAGRAIRLPVGYVLVAIGAVLLSVTLTYTLGYWRGKHAERAEQEAHRLDSIRAGGFARDPLAGTGAAPGASAPGASAPGTPARPERPGERGPARAEPDLAGQAGAPRAAAPGAPVRDAGPIETDPRVRGRYYLTISETSQEGGLRLATWCREQGLEAYVVISDNSPLRRQVILLPGFERGSPSDPAVQSLREEVSRLGRTWKSERRGETALDDAYLNRFDG